jgi:hypothetical protein
MADSDEEMQAMYDKYELAVVGTAGCLLEFGSITALPNALEDFYCAVEGAPWDAVKYASFIGEVAKNLRGRAEELCDCDCHLVDKLCIESGCWYHEHPVSASFEQFFAFLDQMDHMATLEDASDIVIATANNIWPAIGWTFENLQDWPPCSEAFITVQWVCEKTFGSGEDKKPWPQDQVDQFWRFQASAPGVPNVISSVTTLSAAARLGYVAHHILPPLLAQLPAPTTPPRDTSLAPQQTVLPDGYTV